MDPKVLDTLRYVLMGAIFLALGIFGLRTYKGYSARKQVVAAMRNDISDANFYHALTEKDARATLLRCIGRLQRAKDLGIEPSAFFDMVFDHKKKDLMSSDDDSGNLPTKEQLVRDSIGVAFEHAKQMGLLEEKDAAKVLAGGEMPTVSPAPVFSTLVDPKLSPGLERVVPNLQLTPAVKAGAAAAPTDVERAAARKLLNQLADASVIEREAARRLIESYQNVSKPAETPAAAPK